jgi:hypothetical protein
MERFSPESLLLLERLQQAIQRLLKLTDEQSRQPRNAMLAYLQSDQTQSLDSPLLRNFIADLTRLCTSMGLDHSLRSVAKLEDNPPRTDRELAIYYGMVMDELFTHKFFHIPAERAEYWSKPGIVSKEVREQFGEAASEMKAAGTAYACDLPTACVFHAMRAAEQAMRKIAAELGIELTQEEQWKNVVDQIEAKARAIEGKQGYKGKKADQQFYSDAALQLGLMKDAWRNYTAHAKVTYQPPEALDIMQATCRFLDKVASRGSEKAS